MKLFYSQHIFYTYYTFTVLILISTICGQKLLTDDIKTKCHKKNSSGRNRFIIDPEELDELWKLPFRNASKIWKDFVPWIDKPVRIEKLPEIVQKTIKKYQTSGEFNVTYKRNNSCFVLKPIDLLCEMKKRILFRTIKFGDGPFSTKKWKKYLPKREFNEELPRYKTCAVVTSSSSLKNLSLGEEIDRHDAVFRYNFAPSKGFEKDVGSKTTIRMINSMAFYRSYETFVNISSEKDIIFHFDPSQYHANLYKWYKFPQFPFHDLYMKHRDRFPKQQFFLIDPRSLWSMWDFIQDFSGDVIQKIITSSGFMGNVITMNLCDVTHIYGYLPSVTGVTKKCYYFKDIEDMTCTYGGYHPELYEKNVFVQIRQGLRDDVYQWGRITVPGLNDYSCVD